MIRHLPLVLAAVVALAAPPRAGAQSREALRLFEEGTSRLESGNFAGAVASFLAAEDQGVGSAPLYYNLGSAYFRLDQLGQSIRYFERARRLAPDDRRILHNLEIARSKIVDRFSRLPTPVWTQAWQGVVRVFGPGGLFTLGTLAWFTLAALLLAAIRRGRSSDWIRRGVMVSALAAVLFLASAFAASIRPPYGSQSVVIEDSMPLYASIGEDLVMDLHEGVTVDILEANGVWLFVRLQNGVTGWIEATGLAGI